MIICVMLKRAIFFFCAACDVPLRKIFWKLQSGWGVKFSYLLEIFFDLAGNTTERSAILMRCIEESVHCDFFRHLAFSLVSSGKLCPGHSDT